jgi:hypothetical protein
MSKDPVIVIHIPSEYNGVELNDLRNRCRVGTLRECCVQYGIPMKVSGGVVILKAKRNKMQKFMEILHFSGLPYSVMD